MNDTRLQRIMTEDWGEDWGSKPATSVQPINCPVEEDWGSAPSANNDTIQEKSTNNNDDPWGSVTATNHSNHANKMNKTDSNSAGSWSISFSSNSNRNDNRNNNRDNNRFHHNSGVHNNDRDNYRNNQSDRHAKNGDDCWGSASTVNKQNDSAGGSDSDPWGAPSVEVSNNRMVSSSSSANVDAWGTVSTFDDNKSNHKRSSNESSSKNPSMNPQQEDRPAPYRPEELNLEEEAKLQAEGAGENFKRYKDLLVTCLPQNAVKPIVKFEDVIESKLLLKNVTNLKYEELTPIQKWAMPAIFGGHDIIGCAQTGSGKTAAFLLPILQNIMNLDLSEHDLNADCQNPYCLIISPTRELARQIYTHAEMLSKDSIIKCRVIYGQIATQHLKAQLSRGCHVLVATLGRLKDFVERGWIGFRNIKYIVLDEGDRLVDEGFTGDIEKIFNHETMPAKEERQTLFFSATFKHGIQGNARKYLKDSFIFLTVGKIGAANDDIKQEFIQVARAEKKRELKNILKGFSPDDKCIIFTQTKFTADLLAGFFSALNLPSTSIHGDRHQAQREEAIALFRRGVKRFLVSSPVGNRGLDLPKVALVINYDMPDSIDEYVHRIGRTGRAGHTGRAISFIDKERDREVLPKLIRILKDAKQEVPEWLNDDVNPKQVEGNDWSANGSPQIAGADEDWTGEEMKTVTNTCSANDHEAPSGSGKRLAGDEGGSTIKKLDSGPQQVEERW